MTLPEKLPLGKYRIVEVTGPNGFYNEWLDSAGYENGILADDADGIYYVDFEITTDRIYAATGDKNENGMDTAAFVMAMPAFADDPLTTINNLSDFVFSAIKAIGAILLGFGIVQIGLALKGHDASQRAQGFMTFFGGVVIYFAKDILDMIL